MKLSDFAINSIIQEIEDRFLEAKKDLELDKKNVIKQAYFEAYLEMHEIIENRKDL